MKTIEKGEEISVNYRDFVKFNYGSREYRQEVLTEKFAFLCQCSECSLEGEDLQENERMRGEIRENEMEITRLTMALSPRTLLRAVEHSQEIVELVKKLDIRLEFVNQLLNTFEGAQHAVMMGLRGAPDPRIFRAEALRYCKMFGDTDMQHYNTVMNSCG